MLGVCPADIVAGCLKRQVCTAQQLCEFSTDNILLCCHFLQACPAYTVTPDQVVPEDAKPDSELHASVTFNAVTSMDQCSTIPGVLGS